MSHDLIAWELRTSAVLVVRGDAWAICTERRSVQKAATDFTGMHGNGRSSLVVLSSMLLISGCRILVNHLVLKIVLDRLVAIVIRGAFSIRSSLCAELVLPYQPVCWSCRYALGLGSRCVCQNRCRSCWSGHSHGNTSRVWAYRTDLVCL